MDFTIIELDSIPSTNAYCKENIQYLANGTVILANTQTAGKGRMGRCWSSPPGLNITCSIVLKPPFQPLENHLFLPMVTALAIYDQLQSLGLKDAWVKWPNDIWVKNKKIAGILGEAKYWGSNLQFVVLGLGINLNIEKPNLPTQIQHIATSTRMETGRFIGRHEFLAPLLQKFGQYLSQSVDPNNQIAIFEKYAQASDLLNKKVVIIQGEARFFGTVDGFTMEGALILNQNGKKTYYYQGDVSLRPL